MTVSGIKAYAELCHIAQRQPDQVEYLAMAMLGILPDWIKELTEE